VTGHGIDELVLAGGYLGAFRDIEREALGHQAAQRVVDTPFGLGGLASGEREPAQQALGIGTR
jgi:hypothetical protein